MSPVTPTTHTLANGLRVVAVELPHLHTASVAVYVKVGSRFETERDNGLSHFVEHMYFRGTERHPSSFAMNFAIESLGGTLEAETGRDYSMFQIGLAPELVDSGVSLLADLFRAPLFTDIEMERQIILEELAGDYDEDGVEINLDDIARRLTFGDHPLAYRITGPRANIERFTEADVRRHHEAFYGARNMILCVAGPVPAAEAIAAAERHMAMLPPGRLAHADPPAFDAERAGYEFAHDNGSQTSFQILVRAVPELDADYVALKALLRVVDDGMSTRLHYRLCDQLGLAYSIGASIEPLHDIALLEVTATTSDSKHAELLSRTLALLGELRDTLPGDDELAKAKLRYRTDMYASYDDALAMSSWFAGTALYYPPPPIEDKVRAIEAVTAEDVRAVARRVLRPERLSVAVVGGLSKARRAEARSIVHGWR